MASESVIDLIKTASNDLLQGNVPEMEVLKILLSRILGLAIVFASGIIKLPQIFAIQKSKSAKGLSVTGFEAELLAYTLTFSYGFYKGLPFSGYGEAFLMAIQDVVLLALIYVYAKTSFSHVALATSVYFGGLGVLLSGQLGDNMMEVLSGASFGVIMFARIPQIYSNYKNGSTGQLSIFSFMLSVFGGAVRIFTSIADKAGMTMVVGYSIALSLNFTIASQILILGPAKKVTKEKPKPKPKQTPKAKKAAKPENEEDDPKDSEPEESEGEGRQLRRRKPRRA